MTTCMVPPVEGARLVIFRVSNSCDSVCKFDRTITFVVRIQYLPTLIRPKRDFLQVRNRQNMPKAWNTFRLSCPAMLVLHAASSQITCHHSKRMLHTGLARRLGSLARNKS